MVNTEKPHAKRHRTATASPGAPRPRTRLDVDARKEELLALGRTLFGKHTYDELSIARIAELAGVSKGLLYHYFPTKRDYYVETVRAAASEMLSLTLAEAGGNGLKEGLTRGLDRYLSYVEANASAYVSLLTSGVGVDAEVADIVEGVRATFLERLLEQLGSKKISAEQRIALRGWIGFSEAASLAWVKDRSLPRARLVQLLARQLWLTLATSRLGPKLTGISALKGLLP